MGKASILWRIATLPLLLLLLVGVYSFPFVVSADYRLSPLPRRLGADTVVVRSHGSTGPAYVVFRGAEHLWAAYPEIWQGVDSFGADMGEVKPVTLTGLSLSSVGPGYSGEPLRYFIRGEVVDTAGEYPVFRVDEAHQLATLVEYALLGGVLWMLVGGSLLGAVTLGIPALLVWQCAQCYRIYRTSGKYASAGTKPD